MNTTVRRLLLTTMLMVTAGRSRATDCPSGSATPFPAGSYVIPMDTSYQDSGMFVAFGLVHQILKAGIPVDWVIASGKSYGDVDATIGLVTDVRSSATIANASYRGGPFVIDASYAAQAQPIVAAWLAANPALTVHQASTSFVADLGRAILTAPTIAVFADGNEDIAFGYLNAAAIPQSLLPTTRAGNRVVAGTASATPAVTSAPAGNNVVAGTSTEAAGSVVQVFVNQLFAGTTTVQAGGTWSFGPTAIPPGINVTAAVTGAGKGTSKLSGNRASGALPLGGTSAAPTVAGPVLQGDPAVRGTSSEADGTVIKVFRNGLLEGTTTVASGRWSWPALTLVQGGDTFDASATAPGKTESALAGFVVTVPVPATVTPNVTAADTSVAGICKMAGGTPIRLLRTRALASTTLATDTLANGAWSMTLPSNAIQAGDELSAEATAYPFPDAKGASYACPGNFCCPECLDETAVQGPTATSHHDGALFDETGQPRFCQLMSMHYTAPGDPEVVAEVRSFLGYATHAFFECQAVNAFENVGHFLTRGGLTAANVNAAGPYFHFGSDVPFAQADGTYNNPGGSEQSYTLASGSSYYNSNIVYLSAQNVAGHGAQDVWMTGFLDGDDAKGKVSFLGGHRYDVALPISANPKSVGTRYFLDSLYEAPCVCQLADVSVVKSGPVQTFAARVTYTIAYSNGGSSFATNVTVSDTLPAGATFVSATGGGVYASGRVTWIIGSLAAGASGSVQVTIDLPSPGASYTDSAQASYQSGQLTRQSAVSSVTTRYCDQAQVLPEVDAPPQSGLRCVKVNGTDVRITWTDSLPATPCAVTYRIYGATGPTCPTTLAPYQLLGSTTQPSFDHLGVLGDGQTWWYLVVLSNGFTNGRFDGYYGP